MSAMREYIRVDHASILETCKKNLQNLSYLDRKHDRHDRFKIYEHALFVKQNYLCPHFDEVADTYYKALECASSESEIADYVARHTGKSKAAIYFYFRRFRFKNPEFAQEVIEILKKFIRENNLFADVDDE